MESILKNIYINKIQVPKFHGHVRLELRGCRETEVIEHDNHMTDALGKMFSNNGYYLNVGKVMDELCPTTEVAFGGIVLTDKEIPDDATTLPGGIEATACGAFNVANADEALTQGSYNQKESVADWPSKKMTYVYDWTTNQGNGVIAAAALTHRDMGLCGFGDAGISELTNVKKYIDGDYSLCNAREPIDGITTFYIDSQYIYGGSLSANKFKVYKYASEISTFSPFNIERNKTQDINKISYEQIDLEIDGLSTLSRTCNDGRYIYFINKGITYKNKTLQVFKLDITNMTMQRIDITNNTQTNWYNDGGIDAYNEYIYISDSNKKLYEINTKNPTDVHEYETKMDYIYLNKIANSNGKIYVTNNNRIAIFDCITKSMKLSKLKQYDSSRPYIINNGINKMTVNDSGRIYTTYLKNYLATISNLDKPVTKTADKTMKVTYTIQQE